MQIEHVKRRREERAAEMAQMELMRQDLERQQALAEADDWNAKEEEFHLKQARVRADIRIKEGRERAVDILAKNLYMYQCKDATDPDLPICKRSIIHHCCVVVFVVVCLFSVFS